MPPAFSKPRVAVVALRAARHPRATTFRAVLSKRIGDISRTLKDVIEVQYPWAYFRLPLSKNGFSNNGMYHSQPSDISEISVRPTEDPVGWKSETIPSVVPNLIGLLSLLVEFDSNLLKK